MILAASRATRPFDGQVSWFFRSLSFVYSMDLYMVPSKFKLRVSFELSYLVPSKSELRVPCGLSYVALLLSFVALQYPSSGDPELSYVAL